MLLALLIDCYSAAGMSASHVLQEQDQRDVDYEQQDDGHDTRRDDDAAERDGNGYNEAADGGYEGREDDMGQQQDEQAEDGYQQQDGGEQDQMPAEDRADERERSRSQDRRRSRSLSRDRDRDRRSRSRSRDRRSVNDCIYLHQTGDFSIRCATCLVLATQLPRYYAHQPASLLCLAHMTLQAPLTQSQQGSLQGASLTLTQQVCLTAGSCCGQQHLCVPLQIFMHLRCVLLWVLSVCCSA